MAIPKKIYFKIRPLILPIEDILKWIPINANILDLGCGKGIIANYINNFNSYLGVDLVINSSDKNNKIKFEKSNCLSFIERDINKFDTFLVIDLLHHIPKRLQEPFLNNLISKMKSGDTLIIKDIYPKNLFTKFWNSFHDLLISNQFIHSRLFVSLKKNEFAPFKSYMSNCDFLFFFEEIFLRD